jgi:hypothetical protein
MSAQRQDIKAAAIAVGQELRFFYASNKTDLEPRKWLCVDLRFRSNLLFVA